MVTANPARQIGLGTRKGVLAPGADADLVFLDDKLEVSGVMTSGAAGAWLTFPVCDLYELPERTESH